MRKIFITLSLLAGTLAVPALLSAQATTGDVNPNASATICVNLQNDLSRGASDSQTAGEVSILQIFLQSTSTPGSSTPYLTSDPTGFFGIQTENAVKQFQTDQRFLSSGFVGPLTRARIKTLTCTGGTVSQNFSATPPSGTAPLAVNFTFQANQPQTAYMVDFGDGQFSGTYIPCTQAGTCAGGVGNVSHSYTLAGTYTAKLVVPVHDCGVVGTLCAESTLATATVIVAQSSTTTVTATLAFNGATSAQDIDPLASGIWGWSSTNADVITGMAVVTGCSDVSKNATINPWSPWAIANAIGTNASGSITEIPGVAFSGCTMNATYSSTNSVTGAHANATAIVRFKKLLPGDIPPNGGKKACVALQNDLTLGSTDSQTNAEVSMLQAFLQSTASAHGTPYLSGEPTGYFGLLTQTAVKQFQSEHGLLAGGFIGPITRATIKELTCTGTNTSPITVTSPNGGEQWEEGVTNTVTWTPYDPNSGVNPAKDVTAYLEVMDGSGNFVNYGQVQESGKASIHWVTGELNSASQGGNFAPPGGGYYIRVVNNVTGAWDRSDSSFTLAQRPIILMVNGTESWVSIADVNQPITLSWTTIPGVSTCQLGGMKEIPFSTIQPNNGSVSGHVAYETLSQGAISYGVTLQCVRSVNNIPTQVTAYARFGFTSIPQVVTSLKVASPNGGEQIQLSQPYTIRLDHSGLTTVSVALYKNDQWAEWLTKDSAPLDTLSWTPTTSDIASSDVGKSIFKIYATGQRADGQGYIDDKSDAPFTVVAGGTNPNAECTDLQNDFSYRSTDSQTNGEVSLLQAFFQSITSSSTGAHYLTGEPTGFFGQLTRAAVVQFQTDNGLPMVGTVGPATRAKIKALTCGGTSQGFSATPSSGPAPLAVTFTFPGSYGYLITGGNTYKIDFGDGSSPQQVTCGQIICGAPINIQHTYTAAGAYTAKLTTQNDSIPSPLGGVVTVVGTQTVTVTGTGTSTAECTDLQNELAYRSTDSQTNGEVSFLQSFFQSVTSPSTGVAYLTSEPTGFFGQLTKAAVIQFQTDNGLTASGAVDAATRVKIKGISCHITPPTPPIAECTALQNDLSYRSTDSQTSGEVSLLQAFFQSVISPTTGVQYLTGEPTGFFGQLTKAAVIQFQTDKGLATTGVADSSTRAKIRTLTCGDTPTPPPPPPPAVCNVDTEMQSCTNGAYAARIGPNCSWAACPYNPNPTQAPDVSSLTATPASVTYGQPANLSWNVTPSSVTTCTLSVNGGTATSVSTSNANYSTGALTAPTKYTLACKTNSGLSATKDVTVTITASSRPGPTVDLAQSSLTSAGQDLISWNSTNADSCTIAYSTDGLNFTNWKTGTSGSNVPASQIPNFTMYSNWVFRATCIGNGTPAVDKVTHTIVPDSGGSPGGD